MTRYKNRDRVIKVYLKLLMKNDQQTKELRTQSQLYYQCHKNSWHADGSWHCHDSFELCSSKLRTDLIDQEGRCRNKESDRLATRRQLAEECFIKTLQRVSYAGMCIHTANVSTWLTFPWSDPKQSHLCCTITVTNVLSCERTHDLQFCICSSFHTVRVSCQTTDCSSKQYAYANSCSSILEYTTAAAAPRAM